MGWYVSEGSTDKNRISISQYKKKHPKNWQEIIRLCEKLNFPNSNYKKFIRINSNVLMEVTQKLCSKLAQNKTIPFELFTHDRGKCFFRIIL